MSIINRAKYLVKLATSILELAEHKEYDHVGGFLVEEEEVEVVVSDFIIACRTTAIPSIPMAFVKPALFGGFEIFINKALWALPKDQVEAILAHEIGHIQNGDLKLDAKSIVSLFFSNYLRRLNLPFVPSKERAADQAAIDAGLGEGLYFGLRSIRDACKKEGLPLSREIKIRIKELKQYCTHE